MGEALAGRRRWIWAAAAVVVLALIVFGVVRAMGADAKEEPEAATTVAVDRGAVTAEVATTGTVQPAQTRSLSFAVEGTVESVSVRAGTTVTAGQVLAKVDDTDAAEAVDDAQDSLDDAEDALEEAQDNAGKASTTTTTCAANVPAAYTPPSSTPTPTPSPTGTTSPTTTRPTTAAPTTSPTRSAPASTPPKTTAPTRGGTPTGGAPAGGGSGTCSGNNSGGSNNSGGGMQQGGGGDAVLSAEQRVIQARTTLENAEDALAGTTIKAPIAGKILTVSGKVGSQVSAGNAFITLADIYDMQISAAFPEADSDRLALAQKAVVTLADRAGDEFKATVVQVDPVGTSDGTMVRYGVLLAFDTAPEGLLVGQSASVRVTTGAKEEVLRVPSTAVHDVSGDQGTVLKNGSRTKVVVGLRGDQYTEITSGLADGDEIVRSW
ncbi:efflux RND transporter periplasmic adaptor subunit [Actinoplanes bogorensis]|uniref:Efflux RND transporter periplasmic adaptor subunit n=1 Tax=Paractinoplanes bogorensis TaxID=1610840 RepID=A0ABS5Z104_9ACTN|nr:efflux RND transporter periplasmic adaptor subunit [Actinoplanes bogorensis]MBU2669332.1 efflux RND transporter periplasmic adaptor subunit [Actinoplanes bogorensis]